MNILIFGDNTRSTIILKKLIENNGLNIVYFANFGKGPHALLNQKRYCTLPQDRDIESSHKLFSSFCCANNIKEIIPVCDDAIELIRLYLPYYCNYVKNFLPNDADLIYKLKDKLQAPDLFCDLIDVGVKVIKAPPSGSPYFRKPRHSCIGVDGILVSHSVNVYNPEIHNELSDNEYEKRGGIFYHEKHDGVSQSVHGFIGINGTISYVTQRRIHEPGGGGGSRRIAVKSTQLDHDIANRVRDLGWVGPFMVECRLTPSGQYGFVEFNPRFWGSLATTVSSGIKMYPQYLNTYRVKQFNHGQVFVNTAKDLKFSLQRNGFAGVIDFIRSVVTGRYIRDSTVIRKKYFSEWCTEWLYRTQNSHLVLMVRVILERLLIFRYRFDRYFGFKYRKIIFVCRGNVHRSIFAESYCKTHNIFPGMDISSRSIMRRLGRNRKVPISVQKHHKVHTTGISRPLLLEEITEHTAIICFDHRNIVDLRKLGVDRKNLYLLGSGIFFRAINDPDKIKNQSTQEKQFDKIAQTVKSIGSKYDTSSL